MSGQAGSYLDGGPLVRPPVTNLGQALVRAAGSDQAGGISYVQQDGEALRRSPADRRWHDSDWDDLAVLLLTSGSTGLPKAVTLTHGNILSRSAATAATNGLTAAARSFNWMPLDHVGGLVMFHARDVYLGCEQVHAGIDWILADPLRWLATIDRYRCGNTWAPNFAFGLINDR